jgi:hypothetical protein
MSEEDIEASRKKLGISTDGKGVKAQDCSANQCFKTAFNICKYCKRNYCTIHAKPTITMSLHQKISLDKSDYEKYKKYNDDWDRKDGHPCAAYTEVWNEEHIKKSKRNNENTNRAYDILFGKNGSGRGYTEPFKANKKSNSNTESYSFTNSYNSNKTTKLSKLWNIYDISLIKFSIVFAIILCVIATLSIGLLLTSGFNKLSLTLFESDAFLSDFIVIVVISLFYSKIVYRRIQYWAVVCIAIINSTLLLWLVNFSHILSIYNFMEIFTVIFASTYAGNLIGKWLSSRAYTKIQKIVIYSVKILLALFVIFVLGSLSLHFLSIIQSVNQSSATNQNSSNLNNTLVNNILNIIGQISNSVSSLKLLPAQINDTWATEFFGNVSRERGSQYNYCPALSDFAKTRFNMMVTDYGISHYGYTQDFNSYWPNGYTYGDEIYTAFGEEVFYPSGSTPNNYTAQIMETAPGHWQELIDTNLTYYGYYIANGPTYVILGPGGGYGAECPVTEIPGPNINIQQYFAQYGCSVETSNETWFVIELAAVCPQSYQNSTSSN